MQNVIFSADIAEKIYVMILMVPPTSILQLRGVYAGVVQKVSKNQDVSKVSATMESVWLIGTLTDASKYREYSLKNNNHITFVAVFY